MPTIRRSPDDGYGRDSAWDDLGGQRRNEEQPMSPPVDINAHLAEEIAKEQSSIILNGDALRMLTPEQRAEQRAGWLALRQELIEGTPPTEPTQPTLFDVDELG